MTTNNNKDKNKKKKYSFFLDLSNEEDSFVDDLLTQFTGSNSTIIVKAIIFYAQNHPDVKKELDSITEEASVEKGYAYQLLKSVLTPELVTYIMSFANNQIGSAEHISSVVSEVLSGNKDTNNTEKDNEKELDNEDEELVLDEEVLGDFMDFINF